MQHTAHLPQRLVRGLAAIAAAALVLLGMVAIAPSAHAAGVVTGRLVDQLGEAVPGLTFYIHQNSDTSDHQVQSDPDGYFSLSGLDDSSFHYLIIGDTTALNENLFTDANGDRYENNGNITFSAGTDLHNVILNKFVPISGTITNWTSDMGTIRVDIYDDIGGWHQLGNGGNYGGTTNTANFSFDAPISAGDYTLRFHFDGPGAYLDAYLGGWYDDGDASHGTPLPGVAGVGFSGLSMTMPQAALVTGRVTTGGSTPLADILVWAETEPDGSGYDEMTTGPDGLYSLRVFPGVSNSVHAEDDVNDDYTSMTYDHRDGCGCGGFDSVVSQIGTPADDIDFDLAFDPQLFGVVSNTSGDLLDGIHVRLFRSVGAGWVLTDSTDSDSSGAPNFGFHLNPLGTYRLQFVDTAGTVLTVTDGLTETFSGNPAPLDPVPACYAELGDVEHSTAAVTVVDEATAVGTCTSLAPAGSGSGSGGSGGSTHHHVPIVVPPGLVFPVLTPTPSPTPTPTASPSSPSSEPSSSPSPPTKPTASAAPDLWWLLWVGLALLVLLIVAGVIFFRRR